MSNMNSEKQCKYYNEYSRRPHKIVTLWGNQDAKFANEEIIYESEQVMIVKFKMYCDDPNMWTVESCGNHLPSLHKMQFDYIHKSNGVYNYIGQVDRLKIIKINRGIAEMELVILKPNDTDAYSKKEMSTSSSYALSCGKGGARYPCSTKNDVCRMRRWPKIQSEDLIKKVIILQDYGANSSEW